MTLQMTAHVNRRRRTIRVVSPPTRPLHRYGAPNVAAYHGSDWNQLRLGLTNFGVRVAIACCKHVNGTVVTTSEHKSQLIISLGANANPASFDLLVEQLTSGGQNEGRSLEMVLRDLDQNARLKIREVDAEAA